MILRQSSVTDEYSKPVQGARIFVYNTDDTPATLTSDGTTALDQPLISDTFGLYSYYADANLYREDTWYGGKLRYRELVAVGDLPQFKGEPGANVMAIGTFAVASTFTIPAGTTLVEVSGTSAAGDAGAGRQFVEADEVTSGFVSANPLISFTDAGGRGFREIDSRTGAKITPFLTLCMGQSGALGANAGGPNPASPGVKSWDNPLLAWGGSDITGLPWSRSAPDGNASCNNEGLALCHRVYGDTRRPSYNVMDARSGQSITHWVPASADRYVAAKAKIEAALATAQMTSHGKTTVDCIIWDQGPEDFTSTFATHLGNLTLLVTQLRAETWCDADTPIFFIGATSVHDRYPPEKAMRYFCSKVDSWCIWVPSNGLVEAVNTHFDGPSVWQMGYERIADRFLAGGVQAEIPVLPFYGVNPSGELAPSDGVAISTFDSLANWSSRTDGQLTETYSGAGPFTLESRGTISSVTVNGAVLDPATYSSAVTPPALPVLTLTPNTVAGDAVVVTFGVQVDGARATGSFQWGYKCYADGNYSFAYGDRCYTGNLSNYSLAGGQLSSTMADYSLGWGASIALSGNYQSAFGRGHTLVDDGTSAVGSFSKYTTTQTDKVRFQVGNGTSDAVRKNAFAVRDSGVVEMVPINFASLPTGVEGARAFVHDSSVTTFGAAAAGGGTNKVPVWHDGTAWKVG